MQLHRQINGVSMLLRLLYDVNLITVIFQEVLRDVDMLVFEGDDQAGGILLIGAVDVDYIKPAVVDGATLLLGDFLGELLAHEGALPVVQLHDLFD